MKTFKNGNDQSMVNNMKGMDKEKLTMYKEMEMVMTMKWTSP